MRILLSNDDGIEAPGLSALREVVEGMGDIVVVAPETPQSAAGHSITLKEPLSVRQTVLCGGRHPAMSVDGRPADCVRLAIRKLLDRPPDLVLSGINAGANVGVNVFYSGTVAAAAEAAMLGIPAVAFSKVANERGVDDFRPAARLARWVLDQLPAEGLVAGDLINVNLPDPSNGPIRGVRVVPQSTAGIEDIYHAHPSRDGRESYRLGDDYAFLGSEENTDVVRLHEGYITITPLHVDMTNHDRLAAMAHRQWPRPPDGTSG